MAPDPRSANERLKTILRDHVAAFTLDHVSIRPILWEGISTSAVEVSFFLFEKSVRSKSIDSWTVKGMEGSRIISVRWTTSDWVFEDRFHLNIVGGNYFEVDQLIWLDEPKIDQIFHHIIRSFFYEILEENF